MSHVTFSTFAVTVTVTPPPLAEPDTGPHVVGDGFFTHIQFGIPTIPIEFASTDVGVGAIPTPTAVNPNDTVA